MNHERPSEPQLIEDPYESTASWLKELGGRKAAVEPRAELQRPATTASSSRAQPGAGRTLALLTVLTVAYLQYYFLGVTVEIQKLPTVVVYAPTSQYRLN